VFQEHAIKTWNYMKLLSDNLKKQLDDINSKMSSPDFFEGTMCNFSSDKNNLGQYITPKSVVTHITNELKRNYTNVTDAEDDGINMIKQMKRDHKIPVVGFSATPIRDANKSEVLYKEGYDL
jgi:hypothetical protein